MSKKHRAAAYWDPTLFQRQLLPVLGLSSRASCACRSEEKHQKRKQMVKLCMDQQSKSSRRMEARVRACREGNRSSTRKAKTCPEQSLEVLGIPSPCPANKKAVSLPKRWEDVRLWEGTFFPAPAHKPPEHIPALPMPRKAPAGTVARAVLAAAQPPTPAFGLCTAGSRTLLKWLCHRCFRFPGAAVEREHW